MSSDSSLILGRPSKTSRLISVYSDYPVARIQSPAYQIRMHMTKNRLDPSLLGKGELSGLTAAFAEPGHVKFIDDQGNQTEIPEEFFHHLSRIIRLMNEGRAVVMMPVDEKFTTQAAANYLGVSRQHLVDLLESGAIPFHKTGTHRRIAFKDLLEYEDKRDRERHEGLNRMFRKVADDGKYEGDFKGETR